MIRPPCWQASCQKKNVIAYLPVMHVGAAEGLYEGPLRSLTPLLTLVGAIPEQSTEDKPAHQRPTPKCFLVVFPNFAEMGHGGEYMEGGIHSWNTLPRSR